MTATATTSSSTSSAPATSTPSSTYPADVPAEARANTTAGAIAFARYFFAQVNKAYTTPLAGLVGPLSTPNCKTCQEFERTATGYVRDGLRYDRPAAEVLEVALNVESPTTTTYFVNVSIHQTPARVIDHQGLVKETIKETRAALVATVVWAAEGPRVDSVKVLG